MVEKLTDVYFTLNTGAKIPALGLGTAFSKEQYSLVEDAVYAAVKAGYRHIDTAFFYETEPSIGKALKKLFAEGVVKREDLFITTKVWPSHHDAVEESLNQSLKDLGIDYVDLLLQHWPVASETNEKREVVRDSNGEPVGHKTATYKTFYHNLEDLITAHPEKVKAIGVSNHSIPYLTELLKEAKIVPAVNQYEGHPELPQRELFEFNEKHGIIVTLYSPVGSNGAPLLKNEHVLKITKKYPEYTANEVLYSYHVRDHRVVIPRSANSQRITENVKLVPLTKEDITELEKGPTQRYINFYFLKGIGFNDDK